MTDDDWNTRWAKAIGMFLDGSGAGDPDGDFYIAFNAHCKPVEFTIPGELGRLWRVVFHTACAPVQPIASPKGTAFSVEGYSLLVAAQARHS